MAVDYGTDYSTYPQLDWNTRISGQEAVLQAAYRALEDSQLGIDLTAWLNTELGPADVFALSQQVRSAILRDERVSDVGVEVNQVGQDAVIIVLTFQLSDGTIPFTRILTVTQLGLEVLTR